MKNLKLENSKITWELHKTKFGQKIIREYTLIRHDNYYSISTVTSVKGGVKNVELTHIPVELIDKIKKLTPIK